MFTHIVLVLVLVTYLSGAKVRIPLHKVDKTARQKIAEYDTSAELEGLSDFQFSDDSHKESLEGLTDFHRLSATESYFGPNYFGEITLGTPGIQSIGSGLKMLYIFTLSSSDVHDEYPDKCMIRVFRIFKSSHAKKNWKN